MQSHWLQAAGTQHPPSIPARGCRCRAWCSCCPLYRAHRQSRVMPPSPGLQAAPPQLPLSGSPRDSPVIWARWRLRRCFTVISRMSAFSSLECRELCGNRRGSDRPGSAVCPRTPRPGPPALTSFFSASRIRVFSCPRLSLMRARRRFSMMGLDDCKRGHSQRPARLRTALPVPSRPAPSRPPLPCGAPPPSSACRASH